MSVSQWSVSLANLDPVVGSEQGRTRPVIVISDTTLNDILPVVNVLPITSRKPNHEFIPTKLLFLQKPGLNTRFDSTLLPNQNSGQATID